VYPQGEALGWIAFKTGAGILAIYFGILIFIDSIQPIRQSRMLLSGLFLVIVGMSALAWGIHWSIVSGDVKNTILLFGGSADKPLQNSDTQHDRQRPKFPNRKGCNLLIFQYKSGGLKQVDLALAVSNSFPCQRKNTRVSLQRSPSQYW